jgi:glucose-6-phosphate 1-dehydrogenase
MHTDPTDINSSLISPLRPRVMVLFGATGDLARRKLIPGLFHLWTAGLLPEFRILGTSLDDLDDDAFRAHARAALDEFARHAPLPELRALRG